MPEEPLLKDSLPENLRILLRRLRQGDCAKETALRKLHVRDAQAPETPDLKTHALPKI